ncbi:MAG: VanZ family protein [Pseudomonadota bacterium]
MLCALSIYALILLLGAIPGARQELAPYASGVLLHAAAYGVLTFIIYTGSAAATARQRAINTVLIVMAMGALDESMQSFLSYRRAALGDWFIDCTAAVVTAALLWAFLPVPAEARD